MRLAQMRLPDKVIRGGGCCPLQSGDRHLRPARGRNLVGSDPVAPDGTTSDASLVLQNDKGQTVRVTLRGLTGVATMSDVGREAVP